MTKYITQCFNWQVVERFEVAILSTIFSLRFLHVSTIQDIIEQECGGSCGCCLDCGEPECISCMLETFGSDMEKLRFPCDRRDSWVKGFFSIVGSRDPLLREAPPDHVEKKMKNLCGSSESIKGFILIKGAKNPGTMVTPLILPIPWGPKTKDGSPFAVSLCLEERQRP